MGESRSPESPDRRYWDASGKPGAVQDSKAGKDSFGDSSSGVRTHFWSSEGLIGEGRKSRKPRKRLASEASRMRVVGDIGLEQTPNLPTETDSVDSECAHLCATPEIANFVAESGRAAVWDQLPRELQQRLASLPPDVIAALHALFSTATE